MKRGWWQSWLKARVQRRIKEREQRVLKRVTDLIGSNC